MYVSTDAESAVLVSECVHHALQLFSDCHLLRTFVSAMLTL